MPIEIVVIIVLVTWVAIGVTLAIFMGRGGYDSWEWLTLGILLGPFGIGLALDARRHRDEDGVGRTIRTGWGTSGYVDVIVGVDGSPESEAAVRGLRALFGPRLGRVALVRVVPYDATAAAEQDAADALEQLVQRLGHASRYRTEIARGSAAHELTARALDDDYDLIAIGSRGVGHSKALLGSVATSLARGAVVPVITFGADAARRHDTAAA